MTTITSPSSVLDAIESAANAADGNRRIVDAIAVGQFIRQGDVYLERLATAPTNLSPWTHGSQISEGVTLGSRHIAIGAKVFTPSNYNHAVNRGTRDTPKPAFVGPVLVATEPFELAHPEHCDFEVPAGTYQVWYQSDPATGQRVRD